MRTYNKKDTEESRAHADWLGLDDKEWLRTMEAVHFSGFGIARLYELGVKSKEIKSFLLKQSKSSIRGTRLWSKSSIEQYLNRKYEEALAAGNPAGAVAWAADKDKATTH